MNSCLLFIISCFLLSNNVFGWISNRFHAINQRKFHLNMGFNDMLKKAFANENLPPPQNPGLSRELEPVVIEFIPAKKTSKALPGQKLSIVAQSAGVDIKYSCRKGECATCAVKVNGVLAKACQTAIPNTKSKLTIEVLPPKGVKK